MDAVFGMHNWPGLPIGKVGLRSGPIAMASTNTFDIVVLAKVGMPPSLIFR